MTKKTPTSKAKKKVTKPKNPKPKKRQTGKKEKYAYTITDTYFDDFHVLNSANAWWLDRGKVERLIEAFKWGCSILEARVNAGISKDQWDYFNKNHPEFSDVKRLCQEVPILRAKKRIYKDKDGMDANYDRALDFLERKKPDDFSKRPTSETKVINNTVFSDEAKKRLPKYNK